MTTTMSFEAQAQETRLDSDALEKFKDLKSLQAAQKVKLNDRLADALKYLRTSAGEINDCGHRERVRHRKKLRNLSKRDEVEPEDEAAAFDDLQERIKLTTKKLDVATRTVIDDQVWLQDAPTAITQVTEKATFNAKRSRNTQTQTQQTSDSMDVDDDQADAEDSMASPPASENISAMLEAILSEHHETWASMSLTGRYSANNEYTDFYRTVYDANHPAEDRPPMPNATEWFAAEEGRAAKKFPASTQRAGEVSREEDDEEMLPDADDLQVEDPTSDIEVQAERVRLKCPITLQFFEEPLKSTKCPHAFEKKHILDWLRKSTERAPITAEQQEELSQIAHTQQRKKRELELRPRSIRCPECSVILTDNDLRPDPVLARMVKREVARLKKAEDQRRADGQAGSDDDDDSDEDVPRATQRRNVVNIPSSPAGIVRAKIRDIKAERLSIVPQTQID